MYFGDTTVFELYVCFSIFTVFILLIGLNVGDQCITLTLTCRGGHFLGRILRALFRFVNFAYLQLLFVHVANYACL